MLAHRTIAAARAARPATLRQQFRSLHVDNTVNNNFPFKYEGAKSKTFTVGLITLVGTGASLPFLVTAYQM
ncbi:hypothetical protein JCM1840_006189 [Sporobolomyces johnsonii]